LAARSLLEAPSVPFAMVGNGDGLGSRLEKGKGVKKKGQRERELEKGKGVKRNGRERS